ncbi:MAG TPA: 2-oxoacid:acceptor oxidoreductase family protein, partial [Pseudonocardiaceae bacterium]
FCRIDDREIRTREPVMRPDALIVQDPTLLHQVSVFEGLSAQGYLLINSAHGFDRLGLGEFVAGLRRDRMLVVPASRFAMTRLGRTVPNAALLGGFAAISGVVSLVSVIAAIRERFTGAVADGNAAAAHDAFEFVQAEMRELADVATD